MDFLKLGYNGLLEWDPDDDVLGSDSSDALLNEVTELTTPEALSGGTFTKILTIGKNAYIIGGAETYNVGAGFFIGYRPEEKDYGLFIGNSSGNKLTYNTTDDILSITGSIIATTGTIGGFTIGSDYIRDAANSMGLSSTVTGGDDVRFWAGDTFANRASAPFNVTESGALRATGATVNDSVLGFQNIFGDGSDGDVVISSNTTLTEDMFYDDLTIDAGYTLNTGGFRVHVKGTLTVNGTIGRPGNDGGNGGDGGKGVSGTPGAAGVSGTAGAALADGSIKGALAGEPGGAGGIGIRLTGGDGDTEGTAGTAGDAGVNINKSLSSAGTAGGKGGGQTGTETEGQVSNRLGIIVYGGDESTASSAGSITGTIFNKIKTAYAAWLLQDFYPSLEALKSSASSSGGGGGASGGCAVAISGGGNIGSGGGGGAGGGSGSPGGIVSIYAKKIIVGASGIISAKGGNGGNGGNGGDSYYAGNATSGSASGGGAGAGGSGGCAILVYSMLTSNGSITVAGGSGGTKGVAGTGASLNGFEAGVYGYWSGEDGEDGADGNTGTLIQLQV